MAIFPTPGLQIGRFEIITRIGGDRGVRSEGIFRVLDTASGSRDLVMKVVSEEHRAKREFRSHELMRECSYVARAVGAPFEFSFEGKDYWALVKQYIEGPTIEATWPSLSEHERLRISSVAYEVADRCDHAGLDARDVFKRDNGVVGANGAVTFVDLGEAALSTLPDDREYPDPVKIPDWAAVDRSVRSNVRASAWIASWWREGRPLDDARQVAFEAGRGLAADECPVALAAKVRLLTTRHTRPSPFAHQPSETVPPRGASTPAWGTWRAAAAAWLVVALMFAGTALAAAVEWRIERLEKQFAERIADQEEQQRLAEQDLRAEIADLMRECQAGLTEDSGPNGARGTDSRLPGQPGAAPIGPDVPIERLSPHR